MKSITTQEFFRFTDCSVHNEVLYGDFINNKIKAGEFLKFMHISEDARLAILIFESTKFILELREEKEK